jgi:hypothetical protein
MAKGIQHETGLEQSPAPTGRVQHSDAARKKLQARQDELDKTAAHREGKTRPSKLATTEPEE